MTSAATLDPGDTTQIAHTGTQPPGGFGARRSAWVAWAGARITPTEDAQAMIALGAARRGAWRHVLPHREAYGSFNGPAGRCLQSECSLCARDPEAEVLPTCEELGTGFVSGAGARGTGPL